MAQTITVLGIDLATLAFHVVGMEDTGHVVLRKRIARGALLPFIATLPPALIGMEACGSAHYWARRFREHGHEVRLLAPPCVTASVKSPKNDTRDAEAICEAVTRDLSQIFSEGIVRPVDVGVRRPARRTVRPV
jgi:transposase